MNDYFKYIDVEAEAFRREQHDEQRTRFEPLPSKIVAAVNDAGQIELRGPYNSQFMEFYHSLPKSRWSKNKNCWTCQFTPATCWRILLMPGVVLDDAIKSTARRFAETTSHFPRYDQPATRKTEMWRHQCEAFWFAAQRDAALLAMDMGTGKSLVIINLIQNSDAKNILILCPCSVRGVWRREFAKHDSSNVAVLVVDRGTSSSKAAAIQRYVDISRTNRQRAAVVINYESSWRPEIAEVLLGVKWCVVVADESHRIGSHSSKQSKMAASLGELARQRIALTGTPLANSPLDIFGQFRFLDAGIFGTSYHQFRNHFAISGHFGADHIVGYKNQDELSQKMSLITFQVGREVLDLPAETHEVIEFLLDAKERKAQDEITDDLITFLDGGGEVTAPNALVKLLRLQQITGGFVRDDQELVRHIGKSKESTMADLLEDIHEPVVVFAKFTEDLRRIQIVADLLGRKYGEISGNRKDLTEHATMPEGIEIMGVQHAAGGVGIDLTRSRIGVHWNLPWSLGEYKQQLARINRPGQTRPALFYQLQAAGTVDAAVSAALEKKRDVVESILEMVRGGDDA